MYVAAADLLHSSDSATAEEQRDRDAGTRTRIPNGRG